MGEAKRRKAVLGDAYGTPEGSNRPLVVCTGFNQSELDKKALQMICVAQAKGQPVTLIGTEAARALAEAAGLPWLHEIPAGEPVPESFAWDPVAAENGGPLMQKSDSDSNRVVVLGAGTSQWLEDAIVHPYTTRWP